ncbi:hypothetical protein [Rhodosalinus sp. FB01]|uniref:hypothetical protein n=1 Tax=Rhodosalinus sp. FB01 TaxID=3239194 RepID=UPI003523D9CA
MAELEDLERRIARAMDRIAGGVEALSARAAAPVPEPEPAADTEAPERLRAALEEERAVTAQLEERVRAIKERQETRVARLEAQVAEQATAMAALDEELQRLRRANQQLRDNNAALRQANEAGLAEPQLVNGAMVAELEALRALRASETAEMQAVLARLDPLIAEAERPALGAGGDDGAGAPRPDADSAREGM